ncbi:MAG: hypothetical protein OEZ22_05800 [Spirochaetia bacterium]|nr:hypothetical protein [Spirochaetia bacterium]
MKCRKQPHWVKTEIKNIWEVHLDKSIWKKVKLAAKIHNKTYSWIVRYCVFKLANKKSLQWTNELLNINYKLKMNEIQTKHRHMLCLYGDDEILLRNSALILGISISKLIRISIILYLEKFFQNKVNKKELFWYGIKLFSKIKKFRSLKNNLIAMDFHSHKKFLIEEYWGFQ